jgi:hypothetical protein
VAQDKVIGTPKSLRLFGDPAYAAYTGTSICLQFLGKIVSQFSVQKKADITQPFFVFSSGYFFVKLIFY